MPNEVRVILNLFVESKDLELVTDSLVKLSEVTDVYEVTGEYDIVCLLRTESILAFREVLKNKILNASCSQLKPRLPTANITGQDIVNVRFQGPLGTLADSRISVPSAERR